MVRDYFLLKHKVTRCRYKHVIATFVIRLVFITFSLFLQVERNGPWKSFKLKIFCKEIEWHCLVQIISRYTCHKSVRVISQSVLGYVRTAKTHLSTFV